MSNEDYIKKLTKEKNSGFLFEMVRRGHAPPTILRDCDIINDYTSKDLQQLQLAKRVNLSPSTICRILATFQ